ncbi:MAG: DEAD/DEAH box helicase [SAR324 cluster bacterium]|uniref:DEAD/DEAH box helicase n=1 Tax=SAR324 cluster bacterium TaxID=2024889 RepID=A0A7X9IIF9_9DELT|nr:DEAD/DEAH box helicase [SAR324 cluster bacterium]
MSSKGGRISLDKEGLKIHFPYSKERFEFICKVEGARFDKEGKNWYVPMGSALRLLKSPLFSPSTISYAFSKEELDSILFNYEGEIKQAQALVLSNPFSVPLEQLSKLDLDIIFRLSPKKDSIRALPRFRSEARKLLREVEGSHYIKKERGFFFPVHLLTDFLKLLRDKNLSFAIEESLGERLKRSSKLRALIIQGKYSANADELRECLLVPFIAQRKDGKFSLNDWTVEHLSLCFSSSRPHSEKRSLAVCMSKEDVLDLLHLTKKKKLRIWKSKEVEEVLNRARERVQDKLAQDSSALTESELSLVNPDLAWIISESHSGGLLLSRENYNDLIGQLTEPDKSSFRYSELEDGTDRILLHFRDSKLLNSYESLNTFFSSKGKKPPESESFRNLLEDLKRRLRLLERQDYYQNLPDVTDVLEDRDLEKILYPHQRVAVKWIIENQIGLLGDDMGLGKTLSVLSAFDELRRKGECDFLLVACPNSLLKNWIREAETWIKGLKLCSFRSDRKGQDVLLQRIKDEDSEFDGLVINYESLRLDRVLPEIRELCTKRRVFLCLDESQRVKNSHSKTFRALNQIASYCRQRILLSGTPVPRDISDIWAQMLILDRGERFGIKFYEWLPTVAELGNKWSDFAVKRFIPEAVEETILRVHEVLLRRRKENVINLPPKIFNFRDIELGGDQKKRYQEVCEELLLRVTSISGDSFYRSIENLLEEYLRAVQVASNPRLVDPNWKGEPAKFIELDELVKEIVEERGEKLVVWTNYRLNVEELLNRYKSLGTCALYGKLSSSERNDLIGQFQDSQNDKLKIMIAIPAAGGVGLTLTAAQTAIYIDRTWNAEHWLQSIDRLHRIGQKNPVSIIVLNASKVDELIGFNLRRKEKIMKELLGDNKLREQQQLYPSKQELMDALKQSV